MRQTRQTRQIRILSLAVQDMERGRDFYESQQAGLGDYFLDSLFADIDALLLYAGVHAWNNANCRTLPRQHDYG
jgi:hypothetical protein